MCSVWTTTCAKKDKSAARATPVFWKIHHSAEKTAGERSDRQKVWKAVVRRRQVQETVVEITMGMQKDKVEKLMHKIPEKLVQEVPVNKDKLNMTVTGYFGIYDCIL